MEEFRTIITLETNNTIKEIEISPSDFRIDEANLDVELCRAGVLLAYYGDLAAELDAQASNNKNKLDQLYSDKALNIREFSKTAGERVTEGSIEERVLTDHEYISFQEKTVQSQRDANKCSAFFKSMQAKTECAKALAYRQRVQEREF